MASGEAEIGSQGEYSTTIDLYRIDAGEYEVRAEDGESTANRTVQVPEETEDASVTIESQELDGRTVVLREARLAEDRCVVIHDSSLFDGNVIGGVAGASNYLTAGATQDVLIQLSERLEATVTLIAMAHRDTDGDQTYDFADSEGADDGPYLNEEGNAVADDNEITGQTTTATPTTTTTETTTETTTTETTTTETTTTATEEVTTTPGGQPGFTAVVALIALVAAALLAARRRS